MTGLRQKILLATSEEEVKKLVAEGKTYEFPPRQKSPRRKLDAVDKNMGSESSPFYS
jgi:hypothetical protein